MVQQIAWIGLGNMGRVSDAESFRTSLSNVPLASKASKAIISWILFSRFRSLTQLSCARDKYVQTISVDVSMEPHFFISST